MRRTNANSLVTVARPINKIESHWAIAKVSIAYGVIAALLIFAYGCSHVVPSHTSPAKPEFIRVGVQTGDLVEISRAAITPSKR